MADVTPEWNLKPSFALTFKTEAVLNSLPLSTALLSQWEDILLCPLHDLRHFAALQRTCQGHVLCPVLHINTSLFYWKTTD